MQIDEVLTVAAKGISEVITVKAQVNIDLNDAKTVFEDSGKLLWVLLNLVEKIEQLMQLKKHRFSFTKFK